MEKIIVKIFLTKEEKEAITELARKKGKTCEEFVKETLLKKATSQEGEHENKKNI